MVDVSAKSGGSYSEDTVAGVEEANGGSGGVVVGVNGEWESEGVVGSGVNREGPIG